MNNKPQLHGPSVPQAQNAPPPPSLASFIRCSHVAQAACWVLFVYFSLLSFPPEPSSLGPGLDPGELLGLNLAHANHLVLGRDLYWTYGPFTYLVTPDPFSGEKNASLIFTLGVYAVWVGAFAVLLARSRRKWLALWAGAVLAGLAVLNPLLGPERLELAIIVVALLCLDGQARWRYATTCLLGVLAAIAVLLRFNLGLQFTPVFLGILALAVWRDWPLRGRLRWQALTASLSFPIALFWLYVASTGEAKPFFSFLRYSIELAGGYSENMSLAGPKWEVIAAGATFALFFVLLPAAAKKVETLAPGLAIALFVIFVDFKHAFVRQDIPHSIQFEPRVAVAALLILFCASTRRDRLLVIGLQAACLIGGAWYVCYSMPHYSKAIEDRLALRQFWSSADAHLHWSRTWRRLGAERNAKLQPLRLGPAFHDIIDDSSVDTMPYEIAQVPANGWKWRPAPVFEMYAAETPLLDHADAEHYANEATAARYLLLGWGSVDGRNPMLDVPATWLSLLSWYDLRLAKPGLLLLQRRSESRFGELQPLGSTTARWDETVAVPRASGLLVMSVEIDKTLLGRLRNFTFRLAPVTIFITRRSGLRQSWRIVRSNVADGVLINALPANLSEVEGLLRSDPVSDPVVAFSFHPWGRRQYRSLIIIHWYRLPPA